MFNLQDNNISYIIVSPENRENLPSDNAFLCSKTMNLLYSRNYTVIPIKSYDNGVYENVYIAICPHDNDALRLDSIFLMNEFNMNGIIVKYLSDNNPKKIILDGSEIPLQISFYDSAINEKMYISNGISFVMKNLKRYYFPNKKTDLKPGMVIEFLNNEKWVERKISNVDVEYDKMYKLLMKYEKVRCEY